MEYIYDALYCIVEKQMNITSRLISNAGTHRQILNEVLHSTSNYKFISDNLVIVLQ